MGETLFKNKQLQHLKPQRRGREREEDGRAADSWMYEFFPLSPSLCVSAHVEKLSKL